MTIRPIALRAVWRRPERPVPAHAAHAVHPDRPARSAPAVATEPEPASASRAVRLSVRWHRRRLDGELASGATPETSPAHALRAHQLTTRPQRRAVSRALRRVVERAEDPRVAVCAAAPVCRGPVMQWREGLLGLADRIAAPVAVNPCGVARALVLLGDGCGPLYHPGAERSLSETLWWIADGLAPCPPHAWDCPVIMKRDAEHVAWTCSRCGAITVTDDPGVRPA